jgi:hypothetical protein
MLLSELPGSIRPPPPAATLTATPSSTHSPHPTLADWWDGKAKWVLQIADTGLPVGESDTVSVGGDVYWSYLHASTQSAGILDSCGGEVAFPGCVTRWISTDGGQHFALAEPRCLLDCQSCPCDADDQTAQQQYPRVARTPNGAWWYMVYENGAQSFLTRSRDGLHWERPWWVRGTGIWKYDSGPCDDAWQIGAHPFFSTDYRCLAGGPPGILVDEQQITIFVGLGENPGSMGCYQAWLAEDRVFRPCSANPLFTGAASYGPLDAVGEAANPTFDFRYLTSADVIRLGDGDYYMTYEGIRGPDSAQAGGDRQFALGFARSAALNAPWEEYPANPLWDVAFNWGVGHADLLLVEGRTLMITATPDLARGLYELVWVRP